MSKKYWKKYRKVLENIVRYCGMRRRGAGQTPSSVTIVGELADIKSYQPLTSYPTIPHILLFPNWSHFALISMFFVWGCGDVWNITHVATWRWPQLIVDIWFIILLRIKKVISPILGSWTLITTLLILMVSVLILALVLIILLVIMIMKI